MDNNFNNCIYDYTSKITKIFLDKFNGKTINSNDCNLDLIMIEIFGYSNNNIDIVIEGQDDSNIEIIINEDDNSNDIHSVIKPMITHIEGDKITILNDYHSVKEYYDTVLNKDKSTFKTSNDEPTPISCIEEMIEKIPNELWNRDDLKILDPCCGNGNFHFPIYNILKEKHPIEDILENILSFNDTNKERLEHVKSIYNYPYYKLNLLNEDFLKWETKELFDLIVANPPYAKFQENGKRASKNHNLIKDFVHKSLSLLKDNGFLLFITPDNWMSYADRNKLVIELNELQIIHLNIHTAKKYFPKVGSSFTWYIVQKTPRFKNITIEGVWKEVYYESSVTSRDRKFIPQYYNSIIDSIFLKTIENDNLEKFKVETSSYLHKYTKRDLIVADEDDEHPYRLIHTPKQTVYASKPHKFQDGYKVFISTTDRFGTTVDNCGMTQSIVFIRCSSEEEANLYKKILDHKFYKFINNVCRWGNFNNIRILQSFPIPKSYETLYHDFDLTEEEIQFIEDF
jgi:adenine-specific DNA-methyltransferase